MTNAIATPASRDQACKLVLDGLTSLREGLIMYHELGFTTKEIYADLEKAGWTKSLRSLKRYITDLRKEGALPEAAPRGMHAVRAKSGPKPVENSAPTHTEAELTTPPTDLGFQVVSPNEYNPDVHGHPCKDSDDPYDQALYLFDKLFFLLHQNNDRINDSQWRSLCGHCQNLEGILYPRRDHDDRLARDRATSIDVESTEVL